MGERLRVVFREMARFCADQFDTWLATAHHPYDNDPRLPCQGCRKPWPCTDYMNAIERAHDRRQSLRRMYPGTR